MEEETSVHIMCIHACVYVSAEIISYLTIWSAWYYLIGLLNHCLSICSYMYCFKFSDMNEANFKP